MNPTFSLRTGQENGGTPKLQEWSVDCEYGVLRNVLPGPVDHYQWLETSSVSKKSIRRNYKLDGGGVHCMCQALKRDPGYSR